MAIYIDRREFDSKCKELIRDIKKGEATSPTWLWMTAGAALAFIASCIKFKEKKIGPTFKSERKAGTFHG